MNISVSDITALGATMGTNQRFIIYAGQVVLPFLGLHLPVLTTQQFSSPLLLGFCPSMFGLTATIGASTFR